MRRSFGGGSRGMGGGGGGSGGGMLRTVHRAVRAGGVGGGGATHEPFSHATTNNTIRTTQTCKNKTNNNTIKLSSSSSSSSSSSTTSSSNNLSHFSSYNHNIPISAASSTAPAWPTASSSPPYSVCDDDDDSEWEHLDGSEDERGHQHAYFDDVVFGAVPSRDEVQYAVCALQQVLEPTSFSFIKDTVAYHSDQEVRDQVCGPVGRVHMVSAVEPDSDWIEPSVQLCNSKALKPYGADRVYDAFHLLNTEPSVQRMVVSLSSDKAIWNAVLNNEAVREFRESLNQGPAEENFPESSDEDSDATVKDILSSIIVKIKAKFVELVDKIMKLLNEVFEPTEKTAAGTADPLEEKLRACFLLSVMVVLIVVVTRANRS